MEKVTIYIADWQVIFREGIHSILSGENDMDVIGEAANNEDALNFIEANPPRVAILNANHSKLSGVDATLRIKQIFSSVAVILIMDGYNEEQLFSVVKCGASAYLTREADADELVNTVRKVAQNAYPLCEALFRTGIAYRVIAEFEVASLINKQVNNLLVRLSPAQSDILHRIADGNSIEQLVKSMGINEEAIRHHLNLILTKLVTNTHDRKVIEAVTRAVKQAISHAEEVSKWTWNTFEESKTDSDKATNRVEETIKQARKETEEPIQDNGSKIYQEEMEIVLPPPIDFKQVRQFEQALRQFENLRIRWSGGSIDGLTMGISGQKPKTLIRILNNLPTVESIYTKDDKIVTVILKAPNATTV